MRALDLADEQDHRRGIVLGDMDAVGGVGRAGPAGDKADARPAGQPPSASAIIAAPASCRQTVTVERRRRAARRARRDRIRPARKRRARRPGRRADRRGFVRRFARARLRHETLLFKGVRMGACLAGRAGKGKRAGATRRCGIPSRRLRARWLAFKGLRDNSPPRRRTARVSARRRTPARQGVACPSPRPQAFPRISKLFQGNSKEIPSFSKLFQGFPNFFLGRFEGNQGVVGRSSRNRVFSICLRRLGRDERPGDTLPTASAIQDSAKSDCRKEIVGGDFPGGASGRARRRASSAESAVDLMEASFFRSREAVKRRSPPSSAREARP